MENADDHLSQIPTMWSVLARAQPGAPEAASAAEQLLERYRRPIYRYLLACVRQLDVADDLFQEFALRFLRGDFKNADPGRGRFRNYLKTALHHLVVDHQRKQQRGPQQSLPPDEAAPLSGPPADGADADLLTEWRYELLQRAWDALAEWEAQTRQPLYTVLRFRADNPKLRAAQSAERLGEQLSRAVSAEWVYKKLHLAREKYADLLLREVAQTLAEPDPEGLEQELLDLGLLEYCRTALKRHGETRPTG
jgi:RNA polymerase sigma-70 factor (ECF subfamily)